jgi:peptidoglycan/xylan/chitin deacetylase (PgdA/CDA1 family)
MPIRHLFHTVVEELDRWQDAGQRARFWLRDDDAQEPTPALDALLTRMRSHATPCLLAVIPMRSDAALANRLQKDPLIRVAMHGAWHANHAPAGQKSAETSAERTMPVILAELAAAREHLTAHFGAIAGDWYVPPWNRIDKSVAERLPDIGFQAISTFADNLFHLGPALRQVNTHVDLMDWKGGCIGRPAEAVAADLAARLAKARQQDWAAVGVLAHHLVHDQQAWAVLDGVLDTVSRHPAARWMAPDDLLAG